MQCIDEGAARSSLRFRFGAKKQELSLFHDFCERWNIVEIPHSLHISSVNGMRASQNFRGHDLVVLD